MFHFPGCPPVRLLIHLTVTGHCPSRVPPFGNSRIKAYLQLPSTYRSLSRPSSAISALASTLRSYSLDLASSAYITLLRLLRCDANCLICVLSSSSTLLTGIFRASLSDFFAEISFFPVQFSRCGGLCPLPIAAALPCHPVGQKTASRLCRFGVAIGLRFRLDFSCEPSKRYR